MLADVGTILLVPDSLFWITGRIAKEISKQMGERLNFLICSGLVLEEFLPILRALKSEGIDIVHFLTPHLATQFKNRFYRQYAVVATVHHVENALSVEPISYADAIMTVSKQWHNYLIDSGVDPKKLVMVQNGIDVDLFRPPEPGEKEKLRVRLGLPNEAFVVGFSAKKTSDSCDRKGTDILAALIDSCRVLKWPEIYWLIRGPGWNDLTEQMQSRGAKIKYIPFLEEDSHLAETYRAMDAYVVTSRIEGGPVPLLEAMASGLAVVATPVGIALEAIRHDVNGVIAPLNNSKYMFHKLQELSLHPAQLASIQLNARLTITSRYRWKTTLNNVSTVYETAVDNYKKRSHLEEKRNEKGPFKVNGQTEVSEKQVSKWLAAMEYAHFADSLKSQGATTAARKMAHRAILTSPFDRDVLSKALPSTLLKYPRLCLRELYSFLARAWIALH